MSVKLSVISGGPDSPSTETSTKSEMEEGIFLWENGSLNASDELPLQSMNGWINAYEPPRWTRRDASLLWLCAAINATTLLFLGLMIFWN